jgi:surface antigen
MRFKGTLRPARCRARGRASLAAGSALALVAGAVLAIPGAAAATAHHRHRPHQQALHGSLRNAHVPMIRLVVSGGRGGPVDPGDDYPLYLKNRPMDSALDPWMEYNRECTSFAAWALSSRNGFTMPFHDNANQWGSRARALGYRVDSTPAPGSIAWSTAGTWGHVAYVESVSGGNVYIEEYNHWGNGTYDSRTVPASYFTGYIHFKDVPATPPPPPPTSPAPAPETHPVTETHGGEPPKSTPLPPPAPVTYAEQETPNHPVNTFLNYHNASGMGPAVPSGAWVQVSCKVYDPTILSVNPDGYWYRIASGPWNDQYYSPANTFMNGDPYGGPYTHNTDYAVPNC